MRCENYFCFEDEKMQNFKAKYRKSLKLDITTKKEYQRDSKKSSGGKE